MDEHYSDAHLRDILKRTKKYRRGRGQPKPTTPQLFCGPLFGVKGV